MARRPRFSFPGLPQHLIQRGNNPMPDDYRWSSYRCHALGTHDDLISTHEEYERLGHSAEQRQLAYQELFRAELSRIELEQIRTTVNQGWPLGSESAQAWKTGRFNNGPTSRRRRSSYLMEMVLRPLGALFVNAQLICAD